MLRAEIKLVQRRNELSPAKKKKYVGEISRSSEQIPENILAKELLSHDHMTTLSR